MKNRKYDVFISHSSKDTKIAFTLCEALENKGFICWIAPRNITAGLPYAESIVDGIEKSKTLVVLFSDNSNNSTGVLKEIEIANNTTLPIITLRIEDVFPTKAMKFHILANHWLDAIHPKSVDDFEEFTVEIKNTIGDENIKIPIHRSIPTKREKANSLFDFVAPFVITFILLSLFLHQIYPSLKPKDTIYSLLALSFIFSKLFIWFKYRKE